MFLGFYSHYNHYSIDPLQTRTFFNIYTFSIQRLTTQENPTPDDMWALRPLIIESDNDSGSKSTRVMIPTT